MALDFLVAVQKVASNSLVTLEREHTVRHPEDSKNSRQISQWKTQGAMPKFGIAKQIFVIYSKLCWPEHKKAGSWDVTPQTLLYVAHP